MTKRWTQDRFKLPANHNWKAKSGHQVFVAEYGAVRFDVPRGWVLVPQDASIKFCDRQPPDDECTLEVSHMWLPMDATGQLIDLTDLPVATMLNDAADQDPPGLETYRGEIDEERRGDLVIVQRSRRWIDPSQNREACSHIALARRREIQALLTYDYWLSDAKEFGPVWVDVLASLRVAEWVTPDGRAARLVKKIVNKPTDKKIVSRSSGRA